MKFSFALICLCAIAWSLVVGCSDERNAGGVTDIGNSIAGKIFLSDGVTPAVNARVVAYEDSWKNIRIADSVVAFSDSSGNFVLENVESGMRILYAGKAGENVLLNQIEDSMNVVLGNAKSLSGKISSESSGSVRILGTNLTADLNADGGFSFDSIPPGNISLVYVQNSEARSSFDFYTVDERSEIVLPLLKTFAETDSILVVADASLYSDSSFGVSFGSSLVIAVSVKLESSPTETLRNFVMPVKFNNRINFSAFAEPDSFQVVSESGAVQNFEVDYWTPRASQGVLWVRLDSLEAGTENVNLYVIRRVEENSFRAFLPSDSVLVALHLNGDAQIHAASDSDKTFGFIGYGTTISAGQYVSLDSLNPFVGDFTLSTWALWNGADGTHQVLFAKRASADSTIFQWYYDNINSAFAVYNVVRWDSIAGAASAVDSAGWNLLSLVSRNDTVSMFVNGTRIGEPVAFPLYKTDIGVPLRVGGNDVAEESWNGSLDEIRVISTARSAEWLRMEYVTQRAARN